MKKWTSYVKEVIKRKRHKTQKAHFVIPMMELIEEDVDRHSLVSMAKHLLTLSMPMECMSTFSRGKFFLKSS